MMNRLHTVWLCSALLCSCTLDSTPRTGKEADSRHGPGWTPAGSNTSDERKSASTAIDSSDPIAPAQAPINNPASSSNKPSAAADGGSASHGRDKQDDPAKPASNADAGSGGATAPAAVSGGKSAGGAAGSGGTSGQGGSADDEKAGAGGAAGAESESIRQRFIDAAIEAIGGGGNQDGGNQDGGTEPWRRSGSSAGGLSPDFVLPVLLTMRNSAICFRDVRRCVEMCVVLSTDCKACAADPECGQALKDVCGPTIGSCGNP